jgi:murein DD-endopeptidase MepM/ murein hydrolase activator NlpD
MARRRGMAVAPPTRRRGARASSLRLALGGALVAAVVLGFMAWSAGWLDLIRPADSPDAQPARSGAVAWLASTPTAGAPAARPPAGSSPHAGSPGPTPGASSPRPTATGSPAAVGSSSPGSTPLRAAPSSSRGFQLRRTVVPMHFPLPAQAAYRYISDFLVRRAGRPYAYNHILPVRRGGRPHRAHDGVDIRVPLGTRVLSPFDGIVVDPGRRWKPWVQARYGMTVVVVSEEATSRGYAALLAHLSRLNVAVGDRVKRGQLLGRTGRTGNAAGTPAHLHFELRAPFLLHVRQGPVVRTVDAFDPYPSLVAADARRSGPTRKATDRAGASRP